MKFGMVIDLSRCVGCGSCALVCKTENNTRNRSDTGQSYNWADFLMHSEGTFPNTKHLVMPVLCNHCDAAPCVKICPGNPEKAGKGKPYKALFKTPEGITLHHPELCVGCGDCQKACPYSHEKLDAKSLNGETYSVISLNPADDEPQPFWADKTAAIDGGTSSGFEVATKAGARVPAMNDWKSGDLQAIRKTRVRLPLVPDWKSGDQQAIRKDDLIEKCTFCYHRTLNGLQPACVEVCPSQARIFGDQKDPNSKIAMILKKEKYFRLKEDRGTNPNVFYVGKYSPRS